MKSDDKTTLPKVRIAVLGNVNVGKSGKRAKEAKELMRLPICKTIA